jgi:nitroimidazol reductase NimA-like FMN-containing flavoprotein (pyridoxamine 5'-phosphate oxidase superfamily)
MDSKLRAREIIEKVRYITVATVTPDGRPWGTPVFAAYDDRYNFYWKSMADAVHSRNIRENPNIYFTIYDSTAAPGAGSGVYCTAQAAELSEISEIEKAIMLVYERKHSISRTVGEFLNDSPARMYIARPEKFWLTLDEWVRLDPANAKREIQLL